MRLVYRRRALRVGVTPTSIWFLMYGSAFAMSCDSTSARNAIGTLFSRMARRMA